MFPSLHSKPLFYSRFRQTHNMSRTLVQKIIKFTLKKYPLSCGKVPDRNLHVSSTCSTFITPREPRGASGEEKKLPAAITRQLEFLTQEIRKASLTTSALSQRNSVSTSYDRNYITEQRALEEYLLDPTDLAGLRMTVRRSANETDPPHRVYWRKDIETKAVAKW